MIELVASENVSMATIYSVLWTDRKQNILRKSILCDDYVSIIADATSVSTFLKAGKYNKLTQEERAAIAKYA